MVAPWKKSDHWPRLHIKKQKYYFANKGLSSQSCGVSRENECESRTIRKADHIRIYAFELWCWRRILRVPWTARRSNQSILKEISPGKDPDAVKDWRQEEMGMTEGKIVGWHHWFDGHEFEQAPGDGEDREAVVSMGSQRVIHNWATKQKQYV